MRIMNIEFETIEEAQKAQQVFPFCGVCKSGNKLHSIHGRVFLLCIKRPNTHLSIGDGTSYS